MFFKITLHLSLLTFVLLLWSFSSPSTTLFVGGIASSLIYGILTIAECWDSKEVISPFSYHFLWNWAALGMAAVYFALSTWHGEWSHFDTVNYVNPKSLAAGYVLCLSGSFLLHATLRLSQPRTKVPSEKKRVINPILGMLMFIGGCIVIMAPRGLPALQGLFASLLRYSPLALLMAVAFGCKARRFYWTKLLFGTCLLVAANLLALFPYKSGVLQSFFPLIIALWKKSRGLTITCLCLIPILYLGIVAPYVTASRNKNANTTMDSLSDDADMMPSLPISEAASMARDGNAISTLMARIFEPIEAGFIVHDVHLHGFIWGETFKNVQYALVPRFVWPDKPEMNAAKWFTEYLGYNYDSYTSMSGAGELYWNFSVPGVILGTIIVGLLYSFLWKLSEQFGKDTYVGALLYVLVLISTFSSGNGSESLVMVPSILVLLSPFFILPQIKNCYIWYFSRPLTLRQQKGMLRNQP